VVKAGEARPAYGIAHTTGPIGTVDGAAQYALTVIGCIAEVGGRAELASVAGVTSRARAIARQHVARGAVPVAVAWNTIRGPGSHAGTGIVARTTARAWRTGWATVGTIAGARQARDSRGSAHAVLNTDSTRTWYANAGWKRGAQVVIFDAALAVVALGVTCAGTADARGCAACSRLSVAVTCGACGVSTGSTEVKVLATGANAT